MPQLLKSFFLGGFECSSHRRHDRTQMDLLAGTHHDELALDDYALLQEAGIRTVRDGLRWHRIETAPGVYDWSSFLPMLRAAEAIGTQVIWDLCHWGLPHDIDIFRPEFVDRFAAFARAVACVVRDQSAAIPFYAPMNEISFWSWIGGDKRGFYPYKSKRGGELKRQLVRASLAAIHAVRSVDPRARFVQPEPVIHIVPNPKLPQDDQFIEGYNEAQYEAWDMLAGRLQPELGGSPEMLDIVGVNYYWNNQWIHKGPVVPLGHHAFRPFSSILEAVHRRYERPIIITETGAEAASALGWLRYACGEARVAMLAGVPLEGVCTYPVSDYPGWEDGRHCHCGLIAIGEDWRSRWLREDLLAQLEEERACFTRLFGAEAGVAEAPEPAMAGW